jgi:hypothetical protein
MIEQMQHTLHTESISIATAPFDPRKAPIWFPGLTMTPEWIGPRLISLLAPLLLLPLALLGFHRFDPTRTRRIAAKTDRYWIGRGQALLKPLSRRAVALLTKAGGRDSLGSWADAILTFTLHPFSLGAWIALTIAELVAPLRDVLPIAFAVLAVVLADVTTRDVQAGTMNSLHSMPGLRETYVWWKLGSSFLIGLLFCVVAIVRTIPLGCFALLALLGGIFFVAAGATALGILTSNPKSFIVGFLSFWYLVVNDRGAHALWDFAGFYGRANVATVAGYLLFSVGAVVFAQLFYRVRLSRN